MWVALVAATIICCEILFRLPLRQKLADLSRAARGLLFVMRTPRASDIRKERLLLASALRMFRISMFLLAWISVMALLFFGAGVLTADSPHSAFAVLTNPANIAIVTLLAVSYLVIRGKLTRR